MIDARTLWQPRRDQRVGAMALLAAMLVATAAFVLLAGSRPELVALTACGLLAFALCFREPRLVVPIVIIALPLEISKLWFPFLPVREEFGGGLPTSSVLDAGRLAVAMGVTVWLLRPGIDRRAAFPSSRLALPTFLLLAVYVFSALGARDGEAARTEVLRLAVLIGLWGLVPVFVRDVTSLRWCAAALIGSAAALAAVGVYQQVTGHFFWNEGLGLFGERRINTTFADPNHFARLLVAALALGLTLFFFTTPRLRRLLGVALGLCALTLVFTGSRSGWIIALAMLPLLALFLPVRRRLRAQLLGVAALGLVCAVALGLAISPYFRERVDTFKFGVEASGARPYLVDAGWQMFRDQPLVGVGIGGYQNAFVDDYYYFKDPNIKANVTLSHTSAVTVIAEMGVLGALAALFLLYRWARLGRRLHGRSSGEMRAFVVGLWGISLVILLSSQSEGRFFEDPYLWLMFGLGAAMERILDDTPSQEKELDAPLLSR